jgi:beta-glucosidase/6-phospho-beta-glucosidase/beta-galactosidase
VNFYRFSLSWSRILPTGRFDQINQAGVDYYNNLIDALIANEITPLVKQAWTKLNKIKLNIWNALPQVTLYHSDLPQPLQENDGWLNEEIIDWFGEFVDVAFSNFGDRVREN